VRAIHPAHPAVAPLLAQPMVGFEAAGDEGFREPAQAALTIMVGLEGTMTADGVALPAAWGAGLTDHYEQVELAGRQAMLDVKLRPLGAYMVCGCPLGELADRVVGLEALFGADGRRLHEALGECPSWDGRARLMERFLLARSRRGPRPTPIVQRALAALSARDGDIRVEALAGELGCSRRYLHARLCEEVGVGPKTFARLLRFHAARRRLACGHPPAQVAAACGFYDEPHLDREFRVLAGTTPGTPFPFVQDGA
jgi:AraC-like DNA-binding protein